MTGPAGQGGAFTAFTPVCALADLAEGSPAARDVGGVPVVLVRAGGEVFALRDMCSHADVALSEGEADGCAIECWLHGSRFDLRTGFPLELPATEPVPVYPVRLDGTDIYVDIDNPINQEN